MKCPSCDQRGRGVPRVTLDALLRLELVSQIGDTKYWHCTTPACAVVYFAGGEGATFTKDDLRVRVGLKELPGGEPRPICYCFDHSIEEIERAVREAGSSGVLEAIKVKIQEEAGCAGVTKNPSGACCLASVAACIDAAVSRAGKAGDPRGDAGDSGIDSCGCSGCK